MLAGIDGADPRGTAQRVLDRFGSLAAFASADSAQLASALDAIPDLPPALAAAQQIAFAGARERVMSTRLDTCDPAFLDYLRLRLGGRQSEILLGFFADRDGSLIAERTLAQSEGHSIAFSAAAVLRAAVLVGAAQVVLVHNHPSGIAHESVADRVTTRSLLKRAAGLDIRLVDHLIVGRGAIYSMMRRALL